MGGTVALSGFNLHSKFPNLPTISIFSEENHFAKLKGEVVLYSLKGSA